MRKLGIGIQKKNENEVKQVPHRSGGKEGKRKLNDASRKVKRRERKESTKVQERR